MSGYRRRAWPRLGKATKVGEELTRAGYRPGPNRHNMRRRVQFRPRRASLRPGGSLRLAGLPAQPRLAQEAASVGGLFRLRRCAMPALCFQYLPLRRHNRRPIFAARRMGGANGSRECAPDDKLRDTHQLHLMKMMGFAGSTHPTYRWRFARSCSAAASFMQAAASSESRTGTGQGNRVVERSFPA